MGSPVVVLVLVCVELGGIEPPSIGRRAPVLRPFPCLALTEGRRRVAYRAAPEGLVVTAGSFPEVSVLPRLQRSFSPSSPASVAGLRWIGPVRPYGSLCLSVT
jgi:hypothetical protein